MIKWGYMNVYILLENTVNQMLFSFFFLKFFFVLLVIYGTLTECVAQVIYDWTVLEVQTQKHRSLEQTIQQLAPTFQWKQRCNYERMRDKDVKFIHFI